MACKRPCSRSLRHRLTIQTATSTRDGFGQPIQTWANTGTIRASIKQLSGTELVNAKQVDGEVTHVLGARYQSGLTIENRLVFDGRTFGILNVNDVEERHRDLEILCKEIV